MNTRLKKIGMSMMLAALPLMASTASAQWTQQGQSNGISVVFGDSPKIEPDSVYTVGLNQNGTLAGQVASIDATTKTTTGMAGMNVFFVQNDQVIKQTQTSDNGSFEIQGLTEGAYSFFAAGKSGFAAYGVYVSGQQNGSTPNLLEATTASTNYYGIQQLLKNNVPTRVAQGVTSEIKGWTQPTEVENAKQIRLIGRRLVGQISTLYGQDQNISGVKVQLILNAQPIVQVETDSEGNFSIPDVEPGVYDFVAAGQNGFAALRFEAIGNDAAMKQVSFRKTPTRLEACLTTPAKANPSMSYATGNDASIEPALSSTYSAPVEYAGESIAYGGASGGSCGNCGNFSNYGGGGVVRGRFGGGRFGGGTGAGRLLLLGGVAGGIIAISTSDPDDGSPFNNN